MAYDPSDAVTARAMLEDAIALATKPTLATAQVDRAFNLASSLDASGNVVYLSKDLNKAAAWCWNIKAGLVSDQYSLGAGTGVTLTRDQWYQHCLQLAQGYGSGILTVTGDSLRRAGIQTRGMVGSNVDPVTLINTVVPG